MALHKLIRWKSGEHEIALLKGRCSDLEGKLANAHVSLAVAQEQVESYTRAKDEFTKRVAQQIRLPLHGIIQVCQSII